MTKLLGVVTPVTLLLVLSAGSIYAQQVFVFPKQGQSDQQMEQDKFACHSWSVSQTNYDPVGGSQQASSSKPQSSAAVIDEPLLNCEVYNAGKGMVRGAAGGYVTGKVVKGKSSRATQAGAVTGAMSGAAKREQCEATNTARRQRNAQRRALAQDQANTAGGTPSGSRSDYERAYKTCLDAKGYSTS